MGAIQGELQYDPVTGEFTRVGGRHHGKPVGVLKEDGYIRIRYKGKRYYAQVLAWYLHTGEWPTAIVDHRDTDRANNRWNNLRLATRTENNRNCKKYRNNTSGVKGVSAFQGKWKAELFIGGRSKYLGLYSTLEEAAEVRQLAADLVYGDFAREV